MVFWAQFQLMLAPHFYAQVLRQIFLIYANILTLTLLMLWSISLLSSVLTLMLHNNFENTFFDSSGGPSSVSQLFYGVASPTHWLLYYYWLHCSQTTKAERLPNSFLFHRPSVSLLCHGPRLYNSSVFPRYIFPIILNLYYLPFMMQPQIFPKLP